MKGEMKMFLFPVLLAVLIYYLVSHNKMRSPMRMQGNQSLENLKIRFVNGEIDEETYIKMKETLSL
jgi:putative membrane protein